MKTIYGIGTDIVQVARIKAALERTSGRFAEKILGAKELEVYLQRYERCAQRGVAFLATRFSAKEAFAKAIGLGVCLPMTWHAVQILDQAQGQPVIYTFGALQQWLHERQIAVQVSLSDESDYAVSFVLAHVI